MMSMLVTYLIDGSVSSVVLSADTTIHALTTKIVLCSYETDMKHET